MPEPRTPDRSAEPAPQTSSDNSHEEADAAPPEAPPDAEEVEKMTGVPAESQELSTL
jgi:hypothetical protein